MLVYRVFAHLDTSRAGESGNPTFLFKPQGKGRADNPTLYDTWYFAKEAEAAVGEVLGNLEVWRTATFVPSYLPTGRYALGTFEIPDDLRLLDLDNAQNLADRAIRPREVVVRNIPHTQGIARRIFNERNDADGSRKWDGLGWWSYHRAHWTDYALWVPPGEDVKHKFVSCEDLYPDSAVVIAAAQSLSKLILSS